MQVCREPGYFAYPPDSFLVEDKIRKGKTMRTFVAKVFIGLVITTVGVFGADSSIGTWKFNAAKSKSTSTNPIKDRRVRKK